MSHPGADNWRMENNPTYRPSTYYFRAELRRSQTKAELLDMALQVCLELEELKSWVRSKGMIPPKWHLAAAEIRQKGWQAEIVPLSQG